jgi:hypothetical protein
VARRGLSIERLEVGELGANCYLLWCTRTLHALVVDPGAEAERILQAVARLKLVVKGIVDTHGHFDHCGANGPLRQATGAPLMIHEDDADLLAVQPETARAFGLRVPASPAPDRLLKDGDRLEVGDLTVEVIHTPGRAGSASGATGPCSPATRCSRARSGGPTCPAAATRRSSPPSPADCSRSARTWPCCRGTAPAPRWPTSGATTRSSATANRDRTRKGDLHDPHRERHRP